MMTRHTLLEPLSYTPPTMTPADELRGVHMAPMKSRT